jgi:HK97 family phage prohead protease
MTQKNDRIYRQFEIRAAESEGDKKFVEGYAANFEKPTVLYEYEGRKYMEVIKRGAFDGADMSDVIFNFNHSGKVMARTRNSTLQLVTDGEGLHIRAEVGGTEAGRQLHEEIRGGYIDRMSFAFSVKESSYDRDTSTRSIIKFKKIYDVSAVDIPAYDSTSISARSAFAVELDELEREELELRKRKLQLQAKF